MTKAVSKPELARREAERKKMQEYADAYDPPRPWSIEQRGTQDPDWPLTFVVDANGRVIPHFTTAYPSAMVRRIIEAVNRGGG